MDRHPTFKHLALILVLIAAAFILGRVSGDTLPADTWSFTHWDYLSSAYIIGWWIAALILVAALSRFLPPIAAFFESRLATAVAAVAIILLCWFLQFDSFLFAGGNLEVARIAQADDVVRPWYAWGVTLIARLLFDLWSLFGLHENIAGVYAWRTLSFLALAASLVGAYKTASALTHDPTRRLGLFLIIFVGPQFILYFGFVGPAPLVAASVIWIGYAIVRLTAAFTPPRLAALWLLTLAAIALHISAAFVLPAVIAVTIGAAGNGARQNSPRTLLVGLLALAVGVIAVFMLTAENLVVRSALLLPVGKPPHGDYGLLSARHLSDFAQTVFLLAPLAVVALFLFIRRFGWAITRPLPAAAFTLFLGGLIALLFVDPANSVVLDLPRLAIFLVPGAILTAVLVGDRPTEVNISPAVIGLLGALSLVFPLSYLPAYTDIFTAENYATPYLDGHNAYYRTAAVAFRDAYFYRKDMNEANNWDQSYERRSPDYLNLTGIEDFADGGRLDIALPSLNKLIARNPYWAEPRALFGKYMMAQGRYDLAGPAFDTALALDPYNPVHYINAYSCLRDQNRFSEALALADNAADLFPNNLDIRVDRMILNYRAGNKTDAASLADQIIAADSSQAYPYVIKGFLAESAGDLPTAQRLFEKFASLAPDAPETPQIRKRANDIYLKLSGRSE